MNKRNLIAMSLLACAMGAQAQSDEALWLRYPAISPDGSTIAFSYKGDLFTVGTSGGQATQLTTNAAYDAVPVWSPDGRKIAFASSREGSTDVFVVDRNGGTPSRLTFNSGNETPVTWLNDSTVLFSGKFMPTASSIVFPGNSFPQIYSVTLSAQRPRLFSAIAMEDISINKQGDILYHDKKGYEDWFRKHHHSPITRDIWLLHKGAYTKLTDFEGEDRNPCWAPDGNSFYYLSEQDGTSNVWSRPVKGTATQLTRFQKNPVRYLSVAGNGTLCYTQDGALYVQQPDGQPQRLTVHITADTNDKALIRQTLTRGATEIAVSPGGKELAFIVHGDVFVTAVDYRTTVRITDTPEEERGLSFAPDGRSLTYASERDGLWQIYTAKIKKDKEKLFCYSTGVEEKRLCPDDHVQMMPAFSPDGKSIAFFEDRAVLRAADVKTGKIRTLLDGKYNYSYSDGDIGFEWSPDSRWLLSTYCGNGGWQNTDVALVKADGSGEFHNLTQSGYTDGNPKWVLGGKAMIFSSDRAGYRSHGSWGSERDEYIMFFDVNAYDLFRMDKEHRALYDEQQKQIAEAKEEKESDPAVKKEEKKPLELKFDLENCRDRVIRLTVNSSRLGDAILDKKGDNLYYQAAFEGGFDLWQHDLKENKTAIVVKNVGSGSLVADSSLTNVYLCNGGIKKYKLGDKTTKAVEFEAQFNYRPYKEREYLFDHVWRLMKEKFYDPGLHGVDWTYYGKTYRRFLPHVNNNYDFADLLSEMLGELNASHTGSGYVAPGARYATARLGLFYDPTWEGNGLKVAEVLKRGPFTQKANDMKAGCIVEAIDGTPVGRQDCSPLLDGKAGRDVRVTVYNPSTKKRFDVTVKAISARNENELLYRRWVDRNRHLVDSLSHGRLAYVHVKAMDSESFRTVFSELLSDRNRSRDAVIVDERHNGGGWLHDDLCTLLSGKEYQKFIPHGKYIGSDPWNKWNKPSCVLICEDDYSNGHGFPKVYKTLGIGQLIGTPVAGTMTAVWWETLMDRSLYFGIPQVGCQDMDGRFNENQTLYPDVTVYNSPEDFLSGHDTQLERAVKVMMETVDQENAAKTK
ncbi:MAG: S41 family peptidase [Prevotella sp.]|jgi:tricorn protease